MIKFKDIDLVPINREHIALLLVWLNSMPKSRMRPFGKKLVNTERVQSLIGERDLTTNAVFWAAQRAGVPIGFGVLGPVDWRSRRTSIMTYIDHNNARPLEAEASTLTAMLGYAFDELGLNKVSSDMLLGDVYQTKIYENLGFKPEVRKRNHYFAEGSYHHVIEVAIRSSEFIGENSGDLSSSTRKD
jgi:RimJ/RimL family protein N-acetyltransferase